MDETVKESLKILLDCNDPASGELKEKNEDGNFVECSKKQYMEFNYERLANIADLLGMSELYLDPGKGMHK